jgi:ABC-2 type transport system ATP-binding protein
LKILKATNISKRFDGTTALSDVSFDIPEGSIYGLLGPNGAGKTTLLRIINHIISQDEGHIYFNGHPLHSSDTNKIGYLPEERGLYRKMKVGEHILYLARLKGMEKKQAVDSTRYWLNKFNIASWWNKRIRELSKGMQQKVQFLITILHNPEFIIFDEPFSGFDPINANMLKQEIISLKNQGKTIILSTHNMNSVEELCDHITLLDHGKVHLQGSVKNLKESYKSNTYEIIAKGDFSETGDLITHETDILKYEQEKELHTIHLKINNDEEIRQLLSSIISTMHLVSFKELLPSMDEIFMHVINKKQNE